MKQKRMNWIRKSSWNLTNQEENGLKEKALKETDGKGVRRKFLYLEEKSESCSYDAIGKIVTRDLGLNQKEIRADW